MTAVTDKTGERYWLLVSFPFCISAAFAAVYFQAVFAAPLLFLLFFCLLASVYFFPYLFFWLLILLTPFNDHLGANLGGINLRSYTLLVVLIFSWLAGNLTGFKRNYELTRLQELAWYFIPLALFGCSKILTLYVLAEMPPGMTKMFPLKQVIVQYFLFLASWLTAAFLSTKDRIYFFLRWVLILTNGILALAFFQIIISNVTHFEYVHHRDVIFFGRPFSIFREPDVLGCYVATVLLMELAFFFGKMPNFISKRTLSCSLAFCLFFLLLLFVRAAWLAFILGVIFIIACNLILKRSEIITRTINRAIVALFLFLILIFVVAPGVVVKIAERLNTIGASSQESASAYRQLELHSMVEHMTPANWTESTLYSFLFGYGDFSWSYWGPYLLGNAYDQDAKKNAGAGAAVMTHPGFCMPISVFHDNGIIGFSLYVLFFAGMFKAFVSILTKKTALENKSLMICALSGVLSVVVCFLFSYDPIFPFYWILIGFFWGCYSYCKSQKDF